MYILKFIVLVVIAYFIGNISPSIIQGRRKGIDIKKEGSGNAGTTNALRVLGRRAGIITFVVDVLKGFCAVEIGFIFGDYRIGTICGIAVFCGHVWPCFYKFKGGKGVATALGVLLAVNWIIGLSGLAIAVIGAAITRRMSVGSMLGAIGYPILVFFLEPGFFVPGCIIAVIVIFNHRKNIVRLVHHEEPKMSFGKK